MSTVASTALWSACRTRMSQLGPFNAAFMSHWMTAMSALRRRDALTNARAAGRAAANAAQARTVTKRVRPTSWYQRGVKSGKTPPRKVGLKPADAAKGARMLAARARKPVEAISATESFSVAAERCSEKVGCTSWEAARRPSHQSVRLVLSTTRTPTQSMACCVPTPPPRSASSTLKDTVSDRRTNPTASVRISQAQVVAPHHSRAAARTPRCSNCTLVGSGARSTLMRDPSWSCSATGRRGENSGLVYGA
mmetsp:Transcript_23748/g.60947  ORF Transcript_23748/g.60947 Transcript_23748/m.60947 type:complete len:251 (-) Transcript_23748:238-990(-)